MNNPKRVVPDDFLKGVDRRNAAKAWLDGFDAAVKYYENVIDAIEPALGPASDDIIDMAREEALTK
jgi:hypothetical protein